jgi:hypothetical protein
MQFTTAVWSMVYGLQRASDSNKPFEGSGAVFRLMTFLTLVITDGRRLQCSHY